MNTAIEWLYSWAAMGGQRHVDVHHLSAREWQVWAWWGYETVTEMRFASGPSIESCALEVLTKLQAVVFEDEEKRKAEVLKEIEKIEARAARMREAIGSPAPIKREAL